MPTPKKGPRLGGSPAHQKQIVANLATSLFEHGRVTTTETRARVLRPVAERLITKARAGDLHARRQVLRTIRDKGVVHRLFEEIGPHFAERPGGYTRITKLGPRKGDNAPMAVIELVTEEYTAKDKTEKPAKKAAGKKAAKKAPAKKSAAKKSAAAEQAPAHEETAEESAAEATETEAPATEETETEAAEGAAETAPEDESTQAETGEAEKSE